MFIGPEAERGTEGIRVTYHQLNDSMLRAVTQLMMLPVTINIREIPLEP